MPLFVTPPARAPQATWPRPQAQEQRRRALRLDACFRTAAPRPCWAPSECTAPLLKHGQHSPRRQIPTHWLVTTCCTPLATDALPHTLACQDSTGVDTAVGGAQSLRGPHHARRARHVAACPMRGAPSCRHRPALCCVHVLVQRTTCCNVRPSVCDSSPLLFSWASTGAPMGHAQPPTSIRHVTRVCCKKCLSPCARLQARTHLRGLVSAGALCCWAAPLPAPKRHP